VADGWTLTEKGFGETVDLFKQLEARTGRLVAARAMRAASKATVARVAEDAPIRGRESGPLRKSDIKSKAHRPRLPGFLRGSILFYRLKHVPDGTLAYRVSPARRAYYHLFLEGGTVRARPRPWMGRSWAQNRVAVSHEFHRVLNRETGKELKKALRKHKPK